MSDDTRNLSAKYKIPTPQSLDPKDLVLVIEDQTDLRLIVAHQLQKQQFSQSKQASNGYEAIEQIRGQALKIGAYVCDMDMPVMGGLDFLNELQESSDLSRGPFCLTMDNVSKEKIMLAVESGVDEILVKPFTLGDIVPKLRAAFTKFHNPANPERVYEMAKACLRTDKLDLAEKVYLDLSAAAPKAARPVVGLARIAIKKGELDRALKLLDEAQAKNPNFVHLYSERGQIYASKEQWDLALGGFNKAIELSPLNAMRRRHPVPR